MAQNGDIYIGLTGSEILLTPFGRSVKISEDEGGRVGRTSGRTLKKQVTSVKMIFEISYDLIDGDSLAAVLALYQLHTGLNLKIYTSATTWILNDLGATPVVRLSPVSRNRFLLQGSGYWENVTLTLEEI